MMTQSETSIFEVMARLAARHDAIDLGQGKPVDGYPQDVVEAAARALFAQSNQYPPMLGVPSLRQAVATHEARFYGVKIPWETGVLVTAGATEALAATLMAMVKPGDEVVVFEPAYDAYVPVVRRMGGHPVCLPLEGQGWDLPWEALARALSPKTRAVVVNTPHNPTGRVWSENELRRLADMVRPHAGCFLVCDEVYEHLVFDGRAHVSLSQCGGLDERTVRIASAGKTFSLTGWKVGYAIGPPALIAQIARVHQYLVFTVPPNLQHAVAYGLAKDDSYYAELTASMQRKRDLLVAALGDMGLRTTPCEGTYFVVADLRPTGYPGNDAQFCQAMTEQARVAAIPLSAFYQGGKPARHYVRFCFAKSTAMLETAVTRLGRFLQNLK